MSSLTYILNKCYFIETEQDLVSLQTKCFQSLNLAGSRQPKYFIWLPHRDWELPNLEFGWLKSIMTAV